LQGSHAPFSEQEAGRKRPKDGFLAGKVSVQPRFEGAVQVHDRAHTRAVEPCAQHQQRVQFRGYIQPKQTNQQDLLIHPSIYQQYDSPTPCSGPKQAVECFIESQKANSEQAAMGSLIRVLESAGSFVLPKPSNHRYFTNLQGPIPASASH